MLVGQCQLSLLCCAGGTLMLVVVVTLFLLVEVPLGVNMSVMIVENTANKALVAEHTRALAQHGPQRTHAQSTPRTHPGSPAVRPPAHTASTLLEHTRVLPQHGPSTHLEHTPNTPGPSSTSFSTLSSCLATR